MKPDLKAKLEQVNEQIADVQKDTQSKWAAFEQARDEFAAKGGEANRTDSDEFQKAESVHKEYSEKAAQLKELEQVRNGIFQMLGDGPAAAPVDPQSKSERQDHERKSFADLAIDTERFESASEKGRSSAPFGNVQLGQRLGSEETKALITGGSNTSGGAFITNDRQAYVPQPQRMRTVLDLITTGTTNSDTVEFARQTAFTNAATVVDEATTTDTGTKPEATIAFELVTAAVKTIANWVPASRQSLSDVGQMRTIIENQLRYALEKYLEEQIVNGSGSGSNLTGILNTSGILSQAKSSDTVPDAIHKAITQIRLGFVEPTGVVLHPNDWEVVRLGKDSNGQYYYGPPALAGAEQIWGLPVAVTAAQPDDTGLVGDFRQAALWVREGVQVLASDSHSDFFTKNLVAVLAEMRAAFGVLLPTAFAKVTSVD